MVLIDSYEPRESLDQRVDQKFDPDALATDICIRGVENTCQGPHQCHKGVDDHGQKRAKVPISHIVEVDHSGVTDVCKGPDE